MKKLPSYLILLVGIAFTLTPQKAEGWARAYSPPTSGNSVHQTADGGYIFVGDYKNGSFLRDICLIKTDSLGIILWDQTLRSEDWNPERAECMQLTDDGGYIIVGCRGHTPSPWLIKTDSLGDTLWTRTYLQDEYGDKGRFVEVTTDGGYIIAGNTASSGSGDMFLLKTDSQGNTQWTCTYDAGIDVGYCVRQTSDGGYIVTGITAPNADAKDRLWLVKTDKNGNKLWDKSYWGISEANSAGYSVQETTDGGYVIAGKKDELSALGEGDLWLLKTNSNGDTLWTRTYSGRVQLYDYGGFVQQTPDGGYIITGGTNSQLFRGEDLWLLKTDSLGDTLWTQTYKGGQNQGIATGYCVKQTADGGYIVSGQRDLAAWLLKTDSLGDTTSTCIIIEQPSVKQSPIRLTTTLNRLAYDLPGEARLILYSADGRRIIEETIEGKGTWVAPIGFPSGVYFARVEGESGGATTGKLIVVR